MTKPLIAHHFAFRYASSLVAQAQNLKSQSDIFGTFDFPIVSSLNLNSKNIFARNLIFDIIQNKLMFNNTDKNKIFLPHLYEPLRRKIALCYAHHEMRKLLPELRNVSLWQSIDKQISDWYKKLSIKNFWNGIHGISMGFRLKSIVPLITSLHIQWTEKNILTEELWFGGKFGPIKSLGVLESSMAVKNSIFLPEYRELLAQTKQILAEKSAETAPRDEFPIFVVRKENKLRVIDGNRRLLQAIVNKQETIKAFVGEPIAEPPLFEHWVPTSLLVDLVFWHKRQRQIGRDTIDTIARTIAELIRDSSAGRYEFARRSVHHDDEIHMRLLQAVAKILNEYGISLEKTNP